MNYLSFSRSEARISILVFFVLLASLFFRIRTGNKTPGNSYHNDQLLETIMNVIKTMEARSEEKEEPSGRVAYDQIKESRKLNLFNFNPNTVDSTNLMETGLDKRIVFNIIKYREAGGHFKEIKDLKKIYGMNDSIFALLSNYILIDEENVNEFKSTGYSEKILNKTETKIDINTTDSSSLIRIDGISPFIANRIIKYRNLLGGYCQIAQLLEVYGLDTAIYDNLLSIVCVDTSIINKIYVNRASEYELARHPYISYQLAREIVQYRKIYGKIENTGELFSAGIMTESNDHRILPYLDYN